MSQVLDGSNVGNYDKGFVGVANQAARFSLTRSDVVDVNGAVSLVYQVNNSSTYQIIDLDNLDNASGYILISQPGGTGGSVNSVDGNIVDNTDPTNPIVNQIQSDWNATGGLAEILNKPEALSPYIQDFNNNSDWGSPSGGFYTITIPESTHQRGAILWSVGIYQVSGGDLILTQVNELIIDGSGNVSFNVTEDPDGRFAGRVLILGNTIGASPTGIISLNGLTANTQLFSTNNQGADFNINSSGDTHTFNLPTANLGVRGVVGLGYQTFDGGKTCQNDNSGSVKGLGMYNANLTDNNGITFNVETDTIEVDGFTGDIQVDQTTISNISINTSGLTVGKFIVGTGIPINTQIATIVDSSTITINQNATPGTGIALTQLFQKGFATTFYSVTFKSRDYVNTTAEFGINTLISGVQKNVWYYDENNNLYTDGKLQLNGDFTVNNGFIRGGDQLDVLTGQGFNQGGNSLGGQIIVPPGTPITGTNIFGTNLAQLVQWSDDMDGGVIPFLGVSVVGYVGQLAGLVSGKTMETINMAVAGLSDAGSAAGAILNNLNMYTAGGLVGGTPATINNMRMYYMPAGLGGVAVNEWGICIDSPVDNYIDKSVTIGGGPGSKTTNPDIACEIKSLRTIKLANFTTTQKNAIASPEGGMILYDSTLGKMCIYSDVSNSWETITSI